MSKVCQEEVILSPYPARTGSCRLKWQLPAQNSSTLVCCCKGEMETGGQELPPQQSAEALRKERAQKPQPQVCALAPASFASGWDALRCICWLLTPLPPIPLPPPCFHQPVPVPTPFSLLIGHSVKPESAQVCI